MSQEQDQRNESKPEPPVLSLGVSPRRFGRSPGLKFFVIGFLALLLLESLHKRLALITSRRVIPLADWARATGTPGNAATNKAKRQTIPAFRLRDRWMIASEYR